MGIARNNKANGLFPQVGRVGQVIVEETGTGSNVGHRGDFYFGVGI
jgi:hypothetical protein